jgi:hypothetical protein
LSSIWEISANAGLRGGGRSRGRTLSLPDIREKYREKPIYRGENLGGMHQTGRFLAVFQRAVLAKITGKQNYGNRENGGQKQGKGGPPAFSNDCRTAAFDRTDLLPGIANRDSIAYT